MLSFWRDFRYAFRTLRKTPLTSLVIVAILAIGIAGNVAMFSGFEAWVLRPLAFEDPDRLIFIYATQPTLGSVLLPISDATALDLRRALLSVEGIGAFRRIRLNLLGDESPRRVEAASVTSNLFPLLGVAPVLGRNFGPQDEIPGSPSDVVLISHHLWQENLGGDSGVLGRELRVDGRPHRIVGVMPPEFAFPEWAEAWLPLPLDPAASRSNRTLNVVARMSPGRSLEQVREELARLSLDLAHLFPREMESFQLQATSLRESFVPPVIETALTASMAAALFVLLIICSNVASLLMARSAPRSGELALLSALGAGRIDLARRMLLESVLLALAGGIPGTLLGIWSVDWMVSWVPVRPPYLFSFRFDLRAVGFTFGISLLTGVLCGLVPVWKNSGPKLMEALKAGGGWSNSAQGGRLRQVLVAGQFATSLLLVLGAILMVRSYLNQQHLDPGYPPDRLLTAEVILSGEDYAGERARVDFAERALSGLLQAPGVSAAGLADFLPSSRRGNRVEAIEAEGFPRRAGEEEFATLHAVSSNYLSTLQLPLLSGRDFDNSESRNGADVVILSKGLLSRLWKDGAGLGRRVRLDDSGKWLTVIGIAADTSPGHRMVSYGRLPEVQAYVPYGSAPDRRFSLIVRSEQPPPALAPRIRAELQSLDPSLAVPEILSMKEVIDQVQWVLGYFTRVLTLYALLAICISALGTYGVAADSVARRSREMAIRKALGARPLDLYGMVIREGALLACTGILLGCGAGFLFLQAMAEMFFGVSPRDPRVFVGAALLMALVSILASLVPARNAGRVDILDSLRAG